MIIEKNGFIAELWDGESLKCTFKRTVNEELFNTWLEIVFVDNLA